MGYVDQLKTITAKAETNRLREEAKHQQVNPRVSPNWKSLTTQVSEYWLGLPSVLKNGPFCLRDIRDKMFGKYQPRPSAGDLGIALKALKWTRKRDWTNQGGGRRYWYPPKEP